MITTVNQDLFEDKADLIVVPHSTNGSIADQFIKTLDQQGLKDVLPSTAELGEIFICELPIGRRYKYIAFACTVLELTSEFSAIYRIAKELMLQLPEDVKTIRCPMLGTRGGQLDSESVYILLNKTFEENGINEIDLKLCIDNVELYNKTKTIMIPHDRNAAHYTLEISLPAIRELHWMKSLLEMTTFYFELARNKYNEFFSHHSPEVNYSELLSRFKSSGSVFSAFLHEFDERDPNYHFLQICGELIAYIDRHGYNKHTWNKYEDKRTIALSNVNQTIWIKNLLKFKASGGDFKELSSSIRNALIFLHQPSENLTMLSMEHRKKVADVFFNSVPQEDLLPTLDIFFYEDFNCLNPDNQGYAYSRILYIPGIKYLWDEEAAKGKARHYTKTERNLINENIRSEEANPELIRKHKLKALMFSDMYAQADLLNYEVYASVMAKMITSGFNTPPFNISILGPWGKGKTSLMRFIEKKIKPEKKPSSEFKENATLSLLTFYNWITNSNAMMSKFRQVQHPIIWFNAWKFQKAEQVWAGLADEIIKQIAQQLDPIDRERFWLKLNLKRIDKDKLKNKALFTFINRIVFPLIWVIFASVLGALLSYVILPTLSSNIPKLLGIGLPLIVVVWAVRKIGIDFGKPPEFDLGKYVLQPEYRDKMGYLQAIEDDLMQALEIAVDAKKPPVIFIDDLDRCSPAVISELIEAINSLMSSDLSKCYFIIGQDAQMVTASLDVAYEKVSKNIGNLEKKHSSIGRFFMEKFSQFSFNLPTMSSRQTKKYINSLLQDLDIDHIPNEAKQAELFVEYEKLIREFESLENPEEIFTEQKTALESQIMLFSPDRVLQFQETILTRAFASYDIADNELENLIQSVSAYLYGSPRTIKIFLNLFLFYRFLKYTELGTDIRNMSSEILACWLVIMIRWPQLIHAIQWDTENKFASGNSPEARAEKLDEIFNTSNDFDKYLETLKLNQVEALWMCETDLFKLCKNTAGFRFKDSLNFGIV